MQSTEQLYGAAPAALESQDTLDTQPGANTQLLAQPMFVERDLAWEAELLGHLSEQEQRLREFTRSRFASDPYAAVQAALRMVQAMDAYCACQAEQSPLVRSNLAGTAKVCGEFVKKVVALPNGAPPRTFFGMVVAAPRVSPPARLACAEVVRGLPRAIESYLLLLANGFVTGPMAAKWVETSGVFIRQLTKLTAHITS